MGRDQEGQEFLPHICGHFLTGGFWLVSMRYRSDFWDTWEISYLFASCTIGFFLVLSGQSCTK